MSLLLLFLSIGYKVQEIQPPVGLTYIKFKLPATKLWAQIPFLSTFTLFIDIFTPPLPQGVEAEWGQNQTLFTPLSPCYFHMSQCLPGQNSWIASRTNRPSTLNYRNLSFIQFSAFGPNGQQIQ